MGLLLFEIYKKGLERGKDQVDGCHCTKEKNIFQNMLSWLNQNNMNDHYSIITTYWKINKSFFLAHI